MKEGRFKWFDKTQNRYFKAIRKAHKVHHKNHNARSAGLGGDFITAKDQDINIGIANPSLLNSTMKKHTGFNQAFLAGGINYGMVTHDFNVDKIWTMSGYLKYVSYGTFERTDVKGT